MTVHIAVANGTQAVLFSDSQGSTPQSESHGWHKQFLGSNFAVGMAGGNDVINRLFEHLHATHGIAEDFDIAEIMQTIEDFYEVQVRPAYRDTSGVILVGYDSSGRTAVHQYDPGKFATFGSPRSVDSIGSGSQFVARASGRDQVLGITIFTQSLEEMLVAALHYADAANESLTVDDALAVAILDSGKSYLTGDRSLSVRYAPKSVCQFWNQVAVFWTQMQKTIRAINDEVVSAQRSFSYVRSGTLDSGHVKRIEDANRAVQSTVAELTQQLRDFKQKYDELKVGGLPTGTI